VRRFLEHIGQTEKNPLDCLEDAHRLDLPLPRCARPGPRRVTLPRAAAFA
jgi:hypothetical protein